MIAIIGWALCAVAVLAALVLHMDRQELRDRLKDANERSEHWEKEAKALGWKSDFDKITDSLNNTVDQLRKTAEALKKTRAMQEETTAKLKKLAEVSREVAARMRTQNEKLAAARRCLEGIGGRPTVEPGPSVPTPFVESRILNDGETIAGTIDWTAPPKLLN